MMKYIMSFILGSFLLALPITAQNNRVANNQKESTVEDQIKNVSSRETILSKNAINDLEGASWSRDVYRVVTDSLDVNSVLFTPKLSNKNQAGLFSLLFNLVVEGRVKAYKYNLLLEGGAEQEQLNVKDVLDVFSIPYSSNGINSFSVNPYDIPSNEILSYYVKERWYFDTKTGKGGVKILAICPVLHRQENIEFTQSPMLKNPLFWINFDDVSPLLVRANASSTLSDLTKVSNLTFFDYFKNRHYVGSVYQVGNRNLPQLFTKPGDLALEQARIDLELSIIEQRFSKFK